MNTDRALLAHGAVSSDYRTYTRAQPMLMRASGSPGIATGWLDVCRTRMSFPSSAGQPGGDVEAGLVGGAGGGQALSARARIRSPGPWRYRRRADSSAGQRGIARAADDGRIVSGVSSCGGDDSAEAVTAFRC